MFHWFPQVVNQITLYDLVSGWLPCATLLTVVGTVFKRWNCSERRCYRHGHPHPEHGATLCSVHWRAEQDRET
jgi:hypothetical protein